MLQAKKQVPHPLKWYYRCLVTLISYGSNRKANGQNLRICEKNESEAGFEPAPTYVDQNTPIKERDFTLESGALDRSAILTCVLQSMNNFK